MYFVDLKTKDTYEELTIDQSFQGDIFQNNYVLLNFLRSPISEELQLNFGDMSLGDLIRLWASEVNSVAPTSEMELIQVINSELELTLDLVYGGCYSLLLDGQQFRSSLDNTFSCISLPLLGSQINFAQSEESKCYKIKLDGGSTPVKYAYSRTQDTWIRNGCCNQGCSSVTGWDPVDYDNSGECGFFTDYASGHKEISNQLKDKDEVQGIGYLANYSVQDCGYAPSEHQTPNSEEDFEEVETTQQDPVVSFTEICISTSEFQEKIIGGESEKCFS